MARDLQLAIEHFRTTFDIRGGDIGEPTEFVDRIGEVSWLV